MSEFLIRGDTLTGIADAIREKVGSSDGIDPAQMAEMIAGIQSGGEDVKVAYGTFTVPEDTSLPASPYTATDASFGITHDLGQVPDFFMCLHKASGNRSEGYFQSLVAVQHASWSSYMHLRSYVRTYNGTNASDTREDFNTYEVVNIRTASVFRLVSPKLFSGDQGALMAGEEYVWVAGCIGVKL